MKILSSSQIRAADQFTIENEPISSIDLMERASRAFVTKFSEIFPDKNPVTVLCGTGNNGGDGLAIGRMLREEDWEVTIFVLGEKGSPDFESNLHGTPEYIILITASDFSDFQPDEIVIDAIFGSGLSRPVDGLASDLIEYINKQEVTRVAIDIASGLYSDSAQPTNSIAFKPHYTISFQTPKLVFFLPESHGFVGDWYVVDIGLDQKFIDDLDTTYGFSDEVELLELIPVRNKFSHKSNVGKLLIVAGSKGKIGAAALCAKAALRAGVGLISIQAPRCGVDILQVLVPEAMVIEDGDENVIAKIEISDTTFAIGPGIGTDDKTKNALAEFLNSTKRPLVLDADALNILAEDKSLLHELPKDSILTPHPGEFRRLVGEWTDDFQKLEMLRSFCVKYKLNVVLKGAYSAVCNSDGEVYFNPSGNPGMATAGSGDVLTGIVASFLAQGLLPIDALKLGVYIHGKAGDIAAEKIGENSLIASDIISHISNPIHQRSV
ncbi:MAG: NAD(P)H-hydrate dehydratase [Cyclobacteriaceae bacterium]